MKPPLDRSCGGRKGVVFVFNKNGDLYLQKRSLRKDNNPGVWDSSVSGHLDAGEDYLPAAIRELGEEIGIHDATPEGLEHVLTLPPAAETGWEHVRLFVTRHSGVISWPAAEVDSVMPFPIKEIKAWTEAKPDDFSPVFLMMFRGYLEQGAAAR